MDISWSSPSRLMRWMPCFALPPAKWQKGTLWSGFAHASISRLSFTQQAREARKIALDKRRISPARESQLLPWLGHGTVPVILLRLRHHTWSVASLAIDRVLCLCEAGQESQWRSGHRSLPTTSGLAERGATGQRYTRSLSANSA